jgi:membrane protein required for colicin V production
VTWFDIAVFAVLGVSVLLGVMRGLVKELMALGSWLLAFVLARQFGPSVALFLPSSLNPAELRIAAGFVIVLFGALLVFWVATFLMTELIKATGLGGTNHFLGAAFGLVRGLVIVVIAVMVGGLTSLPKEPGWRNAWLSPPFEALALAVRPWMPDVLRGNVKYDSD